MVVLRRRRTSVVSAGAVVFLFAIVSLSSGLDLIPSKQASAATVAAGTSGELDCNGQSPVQQSVKAAMACTDIRGLPGVNTPYAWGGRFYDNGLYIGHDEPDMTFLSNKAGSGNDVTWNETLGSDPSATPTVTNPGSDVSHWFELSIAPWFSMALCNGSSYPLLPCTPESDANAPTCIGLCGPGDYPGAGSSFLELQFYPPGFPPFVDSVSCDNVHWCAAVHINDLECSYGFATCNPNCIEPTNFAFVQKDGIPTGPPSPQGANLASFNPNSQTLMMNPGDSITVHMFNAPASGGGNALEAEINDLTTGQSGFMQASAANGFQQTSIVDCSGTPFNYQPEYSSAASANTVPWAAIQTDISTEFEIGHFIACTSVTGLLGYGAGGSGDPIYNSCNGQYEAAAPGGDGFSSAETSDAACFAAGDTHGTLSTTPNPISGCLMDIFQNGDLDFDGSAYWQQWPTSSAATPTLPASFVQSMPTSSGDKYTHFFVQTDVALSESTCGGATPNCAVPPPGAPGNFYPYWSMVRTAKGDSCSIEFGNVSSGDGVNNMGKVSQYGTNQLSTLGYPEFEGPMQASSACGK